MTTKPININQTILVKRGQGSVAGLTVSSHNAGTLVLYDGLGAGTAASGTLTSSGAMAPATHAVSVLTGNAIVAGNVVVIGDITYTYSAALNNTKPYYVLVGVDLTASLLNLKNAINGNAATKGVTYGTSNTVAHPQVVATASDATTLTVRGRVPGVSLNAVATTGTALRTVWADTTLGGGTGSSDAGVTTAAATITIGTRTYTFVDALSETYGADAIADQIVHGAAAANALDNMKLAINETGVAGTNYSTGTYQNADVLATTNSDTQQVVVARVLGTVGNAIATTETLANYAWGAATLASGTGVTSELITNTLTFSAVATTGERFIPLYNASFSRGLYAVIGGTAADLTLFVE